MLFQPLHMSLYFIFNLIQQFCLTDEMFYIVYKAEIRDTLSHLDKNPLGSRRIFMALIWLILNYCNHNYSSDFWLSCVYTTLSINILVLAENVEIKKKNVKLKKPEDKNQGST